MGIAVLEGKGGAVSADGEARWQSHRDAENRAIGNPIEQAETVRQGLHRFLDLACRSYVPGA